MGNWLPLVGIPQNPVGPPQLLREVPEILLIPIQAQLVRQALQEVGL